MGGRIGRLFTEDEKTKKDKSNINGNGITWNFFGKKFIFRYAQGWLEHHEELSKDYGNPKFRNTMLVKKVAEMSETGNELFQTVQKFKLLTRHGTFREVRMKATAAEDKVMKPVKIEIEIKGIILNWNNIMKRKGLTENDKVYIKWFRYSSSQTEYFQTSDMKIKDLISLEKYEMDALKAKNKKNGLKQQSKQEEADYKKAQNFDSNLKVLKFDFKQKLKRTLINYAPNTKKFAKDMSLIKLQIKGSGDTVGSTEFDIGKIASDCSGSKKKVRVPLLPPNASRKQQLVPDKNNSDCQIDLNLMIQPLSNTKDVHTMTIYNSNKQLENKRSEQQDNNNNLLNITDIKKTQTCHVPSSSMAANQGEAEIQNECENIRNISMSTENGKSLGDYKIKSIHENGELKPHELLGIQQGVDKLQLLVPDIDNKAEQLKNDNEESFIDVPKMLKIASQQFSEDDIKQAQENYRQSIINNQNSKAEVVQHTFVDCIIDNSLEQTKDFENTIGVKESLSVKSKSSNIESWSEEGLMLAEIGYNSMLFTVQVAHSYHVPLQISPDDIWTLVMQGFCQHMKYNHQKLRTKFVNFEGQKTLSVRNDSFIKGQQNPWPEVFAQFSQQIKNNIGQENHSALMPKFSTTTELSQVIHELSLMNAMENFFKFRCHTDCGIQKVRLEGELEDWIKLKSAIQGLNDYDLEWWTKGILWIMDNIIDTYKGRWEENREFWQYIFKYYYGGGSGVNPSIDGWIVNFFPYIDEKPNPFAMRDYETLKQECIDGDKEPDDEDDEDWFLEVDLTQPGLDIEKLKKAATGFNVTKFDWQCDQGDIKMKFISGFAGAKMTDEGFIKVQMGWAVAEDIPPPEKKPKAPKQ